MKVMLDKNPNNMYNNNILDIPVITPRMKNEQK